MVKEQLLTLGEIFEKVSKTKKVAEKKAIFDRYKSDVNTYKYIQQAIQFAYHPGIKFLLPKGRVEFKRSDLPPGMNYENLGSLNIMDKMKYLCDRGNQTTAPIKREQIFFSILENVNEKDAELLFEIKDKKLSAITLKQAEKIFPEVFNCNGMIMKY